MKKKFNNISFHGFISMLFLLVALHAHGQHPATLTERVEQNGNLFRSNVDKAYNEIQPLLDEAAAEGDRLNELILLDRRCRYYYSKEDVENLIKAADSLHIKAEGYKNAKYNAMSYIYRAEAFSINEMHDKALANLEKAFKVLDKADDNDPTIFYTRANVLLSQANIYNDRKEYLKALEKMQLAIKSYRGKKDSEAYKRFQYLNYSNLASTYIHVNADSAEHYANMSMVMKPQGTHDDNVTGLNYYVLGQVFQQRKDNAKALEYYLKAEEINKTNGEVLNVKELYTNIIQVYKMQGDTIAVKHYGDKLEAIELQALKSKYNLLKSELAKKDTTPPASRFPYFALAMGVVVIAGGGVSWVYIRRKRAVSADDDTEPQSETLPELTENYDALLELIKRDDSSFIFNFEKLFPDFSKKLLDINPQLVQSEIEFCAMLKMKLSTKQIAQFTYIETRTVQNKKYRIRKKLDIPQSADIYNWFDGI